MASSEEQPALKRARTGAASDEAQAALERALAAVQEEAGHVPEVATFIVGGRKFQILEQTIKSRGQTMLSDLLSDPSRAQKDAPIYVEGDADRFPRILDWYRFGSIKLPFAISLEEMKRECAFYGLPEDASIVSEDAGQHLKAVLTAKDTLRKAATKRWEDPAALAAAHAAFEMLLAEEGLWTKGTACLIFGNISLPPDTGDTKRCLVHMAVRTMEGKFVGELRAVASPHGFEVDIKREPVAKVRIFMSFRCIKVGSG